MKKIMVTQSSMPPYEEYCKEIKSLWDSKWLTNEGPILKRFQTNLEGFLQAKNLELFVNGHLALCIALKALELKGEIITTPFTFASTTHAIVQCGLTPVFCDVKDDYTIDEEKIESLITNKTSAILPVHVYGNICNVEKIAKIAEKYNLKVIYDAAHAFGEEYNNISIANYGDISMFSFHATKVFHSIEGGCLTFSNEKLVTKIKKLRNFGLAEENIDTCGTNAKMNEFQAAMGICNLKHINEEIKKRDIIVIKYNEKLKNIKGIKIK